MQKCQDVTLSESLELDCIGWIGIEKNFKQEQSSNVRGLEIDLILINLDRTPYLVHMTEALNCWNSQQSTTLNWSEAQRKIARR